MKKKVKNLATGGTVGDYGGTFGQSYSAQNPYTAGFGPEKLYSFDTPTITTTPTGTSMTGGSGLINSTYVDPKLSSVWSSLDPASQKYLTKKWGLWSGKEEDTGTKGVADTLTDINRIISYKGGSPVSSVGEVSSALSPLIAQRNKKGIGGILGAVAPIALSFLAPGIGTALGSALGISAGLGTTIAGAGLGALGSGITGGNPLLGAAMGGIGGALSGPATGAVKAVSGPMAGKWVIPGTMSQSFVGPAMNSVIPAAQGGAASNYISGLMGNPLRSSSNITISKVLSAAKGLGGSAGGQQSAPQNQGGQLTSDQLAYLQQLLGSQSNTTGNGSLFSSMYGRAYAKGGSVTNCMADGGLLSGYSKGRIVQGPGDGMSDDIPTTIDGVQPAALSDGEHVVPALQVSMLGRGSGKAGSDRVSELVLKEIQRMYGKGVNPKKLQAKAMKQNGN